MITVTLYTRKDCQLCEQALSDLQQLQEIVPHKLAVIDIDSDPALKDMYALEIPVVEAGPFKLKAPFTRQELQMTLGAAADRRGQLERINDKAFQVNTSQTQKISGSDRFSYWLSKHYLGLLIFFLLLYTGTPFLAPVFKKAGWNGPAEVIYKIYSPLCHQWAFRSFFLFGEQPDYPLKEAGLTNIKTFDQVSGYTDLANPFSVSRLYARQFTGDATVGYKVAICERDVAIYGAILLFGLVYSLTKRRLPPLHWMLWILIGVGPIGLDGFSQLFSQMNWAWLVHYLPYRESTPFLRVLTGGLFGFMTAWFAYPNIEESMRETRQYFVKKFAVAKASA